MSDEGLKVGDDVVHQSHPGRFVVVSIEKRPSMNVYSDILTIRSREGMVMRVLDTAVRRVPDLQDPVDTEPEPAAD